MDLILGAVEDICRSKKDLHLKAGEEGEGTPGASRRTSSKRPSCSSGSSSENESQDPNKPPKNKPFFRSSRLYCRIFTGHTDSIHSCQFLFDDKYILTSSEDCSVKLWNSSTMKCVHTFQDGDSMAILKAHVAPNNKSFLTAGLDKRILHWNLETNQIMWEAEHNGIVLCCQIGFDENLVASGSDSDHEIRIWDVRTKKPVHQLGKLHNQGITSIKFMPENDKFISTSMDRTAKIYDMKACKNTLKLLGHHNIVSNCTFDSGFHNIATTSWDKRIFIWDIKTGKYRREGPIKILGHDGCVSSCVFTKNGHFLISASYDENIIIWDLNGFTVKLKLNEHQAWVEDVDISQCQNWFISCSTDKTIRMWDIEKLGTMETTKIGDQQAPKVMQCSECLKPFIPSSDVLGQEILLCLYCQLDRNAETVIDAELKEEEEREREKEEEIKEETNEGEEKLLRRQRMLSKNDLAVSSHRSSSRYEQEGYEMPIKFRSPSKDRILPSRSSSEKSLSPIDRSAESPAQSQPKRTDTSGNLLPYEQDESEEFKEFIVY